MPIIVNEGGVLHELETVTSNEGGVLYPLDTVYANEGGILREIHSAWEAPEPLTWSDGTVGNMVKFVLGKTIPYANFTLTKKTLVKVTLSWTVISGTGGGSAYLYAGTYPSQTEQIANSTNISAECPAGDYFVLANGGRNSTESSSFSANATLTVEFSKPV